MAKNSVKVFIGTTQRGSHRTQIIALPALEFVVFLSKYNCCLSFTSFCQHKLKKTTVPLISNHTSSFSTIHPVFRQPTLNLCSFQPNTITSFSPWNSHIKNNILVEGLSKCQYVDLWLLQSESDESWSNVNKMSQIMLCNCKLQNKRHRGSFLRLWWRYTCVVGLLNFSFFLKSVGFYFMLM